MQNVAHLLWPPFLSPLQMFNASLTAPEKCINIRRIPENANKTITMELGTEKYQHNRNLFASALSTFNC